MRVFGIVDGKKNSHSILLRKQCPWNFAVIYIMPHARLRALLRPRQNRALLRSATFGLRWFESHKNGETHDNVEHDGNRSDPPSRVSRARRKGFRSEIRHEIIGMKVFPEQRPNRAHETHRPDHAESEEDQLELRGEVDFAPHDGPMMNGTVIDRQPYCLDIVPTNGIRPSRAGDFPS